MDNNTFFIYGNNVEAKSVEDKDKKRYFIKGYVSTGDIDLVNDVVSFDCIKEMDKQIKSRSLKLDLDHETLRASLKSDREDDIKFNLTKIPLGKAIDSNFDNKGNIVEFE
ncbi:MAG: hypothetical protein EOL97_16785, partial [Spirochaetia bacterium]|nr:hypothetical protein [Spirochaetia bacterium]